MHQCRLLTLDSDHHPRLPRRGEEGGRVNPQTRTQPVNREQKRGVQGEILHESCSHWCFMPHSSDPDFRSVPSCRTLPASTCPTDLLPGRVHQLLIVPHLSSLTEYRRFS
ncbi:unnamed protein product [Pleuronectes platessa]|uniref:Uncharacterized protein n=1 Tax=Pleuronectes platessa TaxID=8262 RepID=A0A9N7VDQ7_PLEPL|nr:unnamed protein product [Pleuronectes platessa]